MATMTITVPDTEIDDFVDYICETYQYQELVYAGDPDPIPNPETKPVYAKRMLKKNLNDGFKVWKERQIVIAADVQTGLDVS